VNNLEGFLAQVLASLTLSGALTATLVWLGKSVITERVKNAISHEYADKLEVVKARLATELETHKSQLQAQSGLELERAKSELALEARKEELLFTRMQEKRAEAIARTFDGLSTLYAEMTSYIQILEVAGITPRDERRQAAANAYIAFHSNFATTRIFLPRDAAEKVAAIDEEIRKLFNQFAWTVDIPNTHDHDTAERWVKISDKLHKDIQSALGEIEDHFRNLIAEASVSCAVISCLARSSSMSASS
jgi:hypothetical protein